MFSLIPILSKKSFSKTIYFVFQRLGSIIFYFGIILNKQNFIFLGLLKKIAGFPYIWFPFFLRIQKNIFLIMWICFIQKVPLYFFFKEILFFRNNNLNWFFLFYFLICRFGIVLRKNLFFLLGWRSVLHSMIRLFLIKFLKYYIFLQLMIIYRVLIILYLFKFYYKKNSIKKFYNNTKLKYLLFFSLGGVPLFLKLVNEIILFNVINKIIFSFILVFCLIIQRISFIVFFKHYFCNIKLNKFIFSNKIYFYIFTLIIGILIFIYGSF